MEHTVNHLLQLLHTALINVDNAKYDGLIYKNQLNKKKIGCFTCGKYTLVKFFNIYCYSRTITNLETLR